MSKIIVDGVTYVPEERPKMSKIIVDGVTYVPEERPEPGTLKIVVLQRGNVLVGHLSRDGDMCTLTGSSVIRRWGTSQGLGQLAADGPQPDTVLDPCGRVSFHVLTSIMIIDCVELSWP